MILRPDGGPENHRISLQLEGVKCNRLALNARVRVTAGDLGQLDELRSEGGYLSQNDLRIHFGLGKHEREDKAEILWPDGMVEPLINLTADRFYMLAREPELSHRNRRQINAIPRDDTSPHGNFPIEPSWP